MSSDDIPLSTASRLFAQEEIHVTEETRLACFQLLLVQDSPVVVDDPFEPDLTNVLRLFPELTWDEGRKVYLRDNVIHFKNVDAFKKLLSQYPDCRTLLRRIGVDDRDGSSFGRLAKLLNACTSVEELTIGVDEADMVLNASQDGLGYVKVAMRPQDIGLQLNMIVLRTRGLDSLRQIHVPLVRFSPLLTGSNTNETRTTGPIPGGILERVVAGDMMRPRVADSSISTRNPKAALTNAGPAGKLFRFLKLPAELRNRVYHHLLATLGPINPSTRPVTSRYLHGRITHAEARHSVLAILQTNKQVFDEAVGIFYAQNPLIFYNPLQLMAFIDELSATRVSFLQHITVWYKDTRYGDMHVFDVCARKFGKLPNLKRLEVILDETMAMTLHSASPWWRLPGEAHLKELQHRKGVNVPFRCQWADTVLWAANFTGEGSPELFRYRSMDVLRAMKMKIGVERLEARLTD